MTASATALAQKPSEKAEPDAATASISHDEFLEHMEKMRTHYTSAKRGGAAQTSYALPLHLVHPVPGNGVMQVPSSKGKAAVDAALKTGQTQTLGFANTQKVAVSAATSKLAQTHDTADFATKMAALEGQAQQQAHDNIHQQFQNLIKIGTAHPEQQSGILKLTNQIGAFFTNLLESVGAFFKDIAAKIMGWINSAVEWIKGAAATVAHWASGAVSTIGHFFSSLF